MYDKRTKIKQDFFIIKKSLPVNLEWIRLASILDKIIDAIVIKSAIG